MAVRTQQMVKEIPQDVLLSLSFSSLPSPNIYMNACVHTERQSVLMKYSKGLHKSRIYPFNNILLTRFRTEKIQPVAGYQRGSQETCSVHGLHLFSDTSLGRQFSFVLFYSLPIHCPLYFYSKILREETFCFWLLGLKTACTMLVRFSPTCFTESMRETACSVLRSTEMNIKISMKFPRLTGGKAWPRTDHTESTILFLHQAI